MYTEKIFCRIEYFKRRGYKRFPNWNKLYNFRNLL